MSIRFWKGDSLCKTFLCRSGIPSTGLSGKLGALSRLLSVVSTRADVVACSVFYGAIPGIPDSETDVGDETVTRDRSDRQLRTSGATVQLKERTLPELPGRSRAIFKQNFEKADLYTFPVGQRTAAFSEPQIHHLPRVLTDQALSMSCSTMEQLAIGAVKRKPATSSSQTEHFRSQVRVQTHMPMCNSDSNSGESSQKPESGPDSIGEFDSRREIEELSAFDGSDSSTEMALIVEFFKRTIRQPLTTTPIDNPQPETTDKGPESTGKSSQDITLSDVRVRFSGQKFQGKGRTKNFNKTKRAPTRIAYERKKIYAKIGWTRSFISGPADPLHNPHMVSCHKCKKNISIRRKGPVEILRHHRTERYLRRVQRWRYQHLKSVNSVTRRIQHRVRGRDEKIPGKIDLAEELPKFIHEELVYAGQRFLSTMTSSGEVQHPLSPRCHGPKPKFGLSGSSCLNKETSLCSLFVGPNWFPYKSSSHLLRL